MYRNRMMLRRTAALAILAATAIAACGSDDTSTADADGESSTEPTDETTADPSEESASMSTEGSDVAPFFDQLPEKYQESGSLTFVHSHRAPFDLVEDGGKTFSGVNAELEAPLMELLGVEAEPTILPGLPEALTALNSGQADVWLGPIDATAERQEEFDITVWVRSRASLMFLADGPYKDATTPLDMCGASVTYLHGSRTQLFIDDLTERCVAAGKDPMDAVSFKDTAGTLLALDSGRVDSTGSTQASILNIQNKEPGKYGYVQFADESDPEAFTTELGFVTSKESGLGPVLTAAFQELFDDGTYMEVMEKYELGPVSVESPMLNPEPAA